MSVTGPGAATLTISGNKASRVFVVGGSSQQLSLVAAFSGLTVANASSSSNGGGLLSYGTVTVSNCAFTGDAVSSSSGGGIYNEGVMTVTNSTFSNNTMSGDGNGAGIHNETSATLTVTNSNFTANTTTNGGSGAGIGNDGKLTVSGSTFSGNSVASNGAGIHNSSTGTLTLTTSTFVNGTCVSDGGGYDSDGISTVTYCTFTGNSVGSEGGAIDNHGTATVSDSTLTGNTSVSRGGGINDSVSLVVTNCTITGNRASSSSGIGGGIDDSSPAKVYNCIVAGNFIGAAPGTTANDIIGTVDSSSSGNLIGTGGSGGMTNGAGGNQVGVTSLGLGALANNGGPTQTMALLTGSPAIDHGNNSFVTAGVTDQRGLTRIVNGTVDIGAFEVQASASNTFLVAGFPAAVQAGVAATITVTARGGSSNTITGYTGKIHFTSSDSQAVMPADYTFVSADQGVHTFSITLKTAATQSLTVTDTTTSAMTGTQSGIVVSPAAASIFVVTGFPTPTTAGVGGTFTVTARDTFGNTASGYRGSVHFASSDSLAALPANYTFIANDNGVHTFNATLKIAGTQSLSATDTLTPSIMGTQSGIVVSPATASVFFVNGFSTFTTAGVVGTFSVTARDAFGNTATAYRGVAHFGSSDSQAALPANYTFTATDNGVHTFNATLKTASTQSLSATDTLSASITGSQAGIVVAPAAASIFFVGGFPSPTTAGVAGTFTVTARDTFGNTATGYRGIAHFSSSDTQAILPIDFTYTAGDLGVHTFNATLKTAGTQSLIVTDTLTSSITGSQSGLVITPAAASVLIVAGFPTPTTAGVAGTFTVMARDTFGNTATGYRGIAHFSSSDGQAALPANYTFTSTDSGIHLFTATLKTAGSQSLTVADTVTSSITGSQVGIVVTPAAASRFIVSGFPTPSTAGVAGTFTITALDTFGNTASGYRGITHFASSDNQAGLPADYTFVAADNGVHTFSATLKTTGAQTLTATDTITSSITGVQTGIVVLPASAATFAVTGFPTPTMVSGPATFTVTALDTFGNTATGYLGTVHFTSSDNLAGLPADYGFGAGDNGVHAFTATLNTLGVQSLTATDTLTPSITGSQIGISVNAAAYTVNSTADNTTADSFLTLREAIALVDGNLGRALTSGESAQIGIATGTTPTIQFNLPAGPQTILLTGGALDVTQPVAINGPGASNLAVNGNAADRVFIIGVDYNQNLSLNVTIGGLTISNGSAVVAGKNYGGGLLNFGTLTVSNTTFTGNVADSDGGGGIFNDGMLTANSCAFTSNSTTNGGPGGGIQNAAPATLIVSSCSFTTNTANTGGSGAGIANNGQLTVSNSAFTGNTASSNAGGIANSADATAIVSGCSFTSNSSGSDGGAFDNDATATVSGSTFAYNTAGSEGGGLASKDILLGLTNSTFFGNVAVSDGGGLQTSGSAVITNCTFTANRVTVGSSGLFGGGIYDVGTAATLANTVVAGNFQGPLPSTTADDIAGNVDPSSSFNLIGVGGSGGLIQNINSNQVGIADPGLGTLAGNGGLTQTVALLPGSPAIDKGSNAFVAVGETDQRGLTRIVNGTVDIGAFEVQSIPTAFSVVGFPTPITAGTPGAFTVTVLDTLGNTAKDYLGTVHFTSSDPNAALPVDYTFVAADNGVHTFAATLKTAGAQLLTATDTVVSSITGTQSGITVSPAAASTFTLTGFPTLATAGVAGGFTLTALDTFGNTAVGYLGKVHFTSGDAKAVLPADYTFLAGDHGVHTFSATLKTAGFQSLTATDIAASSITGSQLGIVVTPAADQCLYCGRIPDTGVGRRGGHVHRHGTRYIWQHSHWLPRESSLHQQRHQSGVAR